MLKCLKVHEYSAGQLDSEWVQGMQIEMYFQDLYQVRKYQFTVPTHVTELQFAESLRTMADQLESNYVREYYDGS